MSPSRNKQKRRGRMKKYSAPSPPLRHDSGSEREHELQCRPAPAGRRRGTARAARRHRGSGPASYRNSSTARPCTPARPRPGADEGRPWRATARTGNSPNPTHAQVEHQPKPLGRSSKKMLLSVTPAMAASQMSSSGPQRQRREKGSMQGRKRAGNEDEDGPVVEALQDRPAGGAGRADDRRRSSTAGTPRKGEHAQADQSAHVPAHLPEEKGVKQANTPQREDEKEELTGSVNPGIG